MSFVNRRETRQGSSSSIELASSFWWESYWRGHLVLPKVFNPALALDRCIVKNIRRFLVHDPSRSMIEVGCCPGRWMVYFRKALGYSVSGVDYLTSAIEYTRINLVLNEVDYKDLICDDILDLQTKERYDVVFSVGFIEHFIDVYPILEKHLYLTAPGGYMIVGLPRFHSLLYVLQSHFDALSENKILPKHNLDVMNLSVLADFATSRSLEISFLDYTGGFLPTLLKTGDAGALARVLRSFVVSLRDRVRILDKLEHRLISNYIFAIFQKPG